MSAILILLLVAAVIVGPFVTLKAISNYKARAGTKLRPEKPDDPKDPDKPGGYW